MRLRKPLAVLISALFLISLVTMQGISSVYAQEDYDRNSCSLNRGLDIVFVMDNSGSMSWNDQFNIRVQAAKNMVDALHDYDRASVIKFDSEAENLQSLTDNRHLVNNALNSLVDPSGGTDISKGMDEALKEFRLNGGNNHKVMIILSDGVSANNNLSRAFAEDAAMEGITIYTIGLGITTNIDEPLLRDIANETRGNYYHSATATDLTDTFDTIRRAAEELREPKMFSSRSLTKDEHWSGDLVLHENMKLDLNGYNLTVDKSLVMLSCSELRATSGVINAEDLVQKSGSSINLNNGQLIVKKELDQDGIIRVNGDFGGISVPEVIVEGVYNQHLHGYLDLNGFLLKSKGDLVQQGRLHVGGGTIQADGNVTQKGYLDLQKGSLFIDGNLKIEGGPLIDDSFQKNKSLNVNGGVVQVGSEALMKESSAVGNVTQNSGQLFVNHGSVRIFGDYTIKDGWLTMTKGSMDTTTSEYSEGDGDYVHVYRNFSMESYRNHGERKYTYLGTPMHDQSHLTDGVLRVDGDFRQLGDKQFNSNYSDRSQSYNEDYSRFNFVGAGRHKVYLTGKGSINVKGSGFKFNILELKGRFIDYETSMSGPIKWDKLIENDVAANADLGSLIINNKAVHNFNPNTLNYANHSVDSDTVQGQLPILHVDARASDHRNAKVTIIGDAIRSDGTAEVRILVTAADGKTTKVYTVGVTVGIGNPDAVASIELDRSNLTFLDSGGGNFSPKIATIGYTVKPSTAGNQKVNWKSSDPSVVSISSTGIATPHKRGKATITATTEDGNFMKSVNVIVKIPIDLLAGVKTLEDFVDDNDRYNEIMSLYNPKEIGIVVPGKYIQSVVFQTSGYLVSGKIQTHVDAVRVEVRVNGQQLPAPMISAVGITPKEYLFTRAGMGIGDYLEVISYNSAGDELERISTTYPVNGLPTGTISPGFYSVDHLMSNPTLFNLILQYYSPEQLRFTHSNN